MLIRYQDEARYLITPTPTDKMELIARLSGQRSYLETLKISGKWGPNLRVMEYNGVVVPGDCVVRVLRRLSRKPICEPFSAQGEKDVYILSTEPSRSPQYDVPFYTLYTATDVIEKELQKEIIALTDALAQRIGLVVELSIRRATHEGIPIEAPLGDPCRLGVIIGARPPQLLWQQHSEARLLYGRQLSSKTQARYSTVASLPDVKDAWRMVRTPEGAVVGYYHGDSNGGNFWLTSDFLGEPDQYRADPIFLIRQSLESLAQMVWPERRDTVLTVGSSAPVKTEETPSPNPIYRPAWWPIQLWRDSRGPYSTEIALTVRALRLAQRELRILGRQSESTDEYREAQELIERAQAKLAHYRQLTVDRSKKENSTRRHLAEAKSLLDQTSGPELSTEDHRSAITEVNEQSKMDPQPEG